jgi:ABC-type polysaccharide/polyol phosphate export permease
MSLVKMDLRTRYRRSVLGLGWSLLHPILMTIILCLVFSELLKTDEPWTRYAPFLLVGLATWSYILQASSFGCHAFFMNESYIRQCSLPLAIYPLRSVLGASFHFLVALGVALVMVTALDPSRMNWAVIAMNLPPTLLLLFAFAWSMAILTSLANVFFQDTQHLIDVAFQALFYLTPIFYKPEMLTGHGLGWVVDFNPFAKFVTLVREPILDGTTPDASIYLFAIGTTLVTGIAAAWLLNRWQKKLIFHL